MDALMVVLAFTVAVMYGLLGFGVVPRLTGAAQGGSPRMIRAARWGATAFFAGCAVTHVAIGLSALSRATGGELVGGHVMDGMAGMDVSGSGAGTGAVLLEHVVPHVAQIVGGFTFIGIAYRRLEWTIMAKEVAEGYRTRETQYRAAFEMAPVGIALVDLRGPDSGRVIHANPVMRRLTGAPTDFADLLIASGADEAARDLAALRAGTPIADREREIVRDDARPVVVGVAASVVRDDAGVPEFAVVQSLDISGRRRAQLLRATQHAVAEAVTLAATGSANVSEPVASVQAAMTGALRALATGLEWAGAEYWEIDPEHGAITCRAGWWAPQFASAPIAGPQQPTFPVGVGLVGEVLTSGAQVWVEDLAADPGPFIRHELALASGVRAVAGLPVGSGERAGVLLAYSAQALPADRDLTSTLEAISALIGRYLERSRAEDFRRLVESAPDAVVVTDADRSIVLVNARTEQLFGYSREELLGRPVELLLPEPAAGALDAFGRRADGELMPVEVTQRRVDSAQGRLVARSIRDLTARLQAEELRFRLAAIVDSSSDAVIGTTLDGVVTSWNRAAEEIFGYAEAEAVNQPLGTLLGVAVAEEMGLLDRVRAGERVEHHDTVRRHADGHEVPVSLTISPIRDPHGELIGTSRMVRDITQRKRDEAALSAAKEAAEAAGRELESFSYSVAHDLKAPLRSVNGFSQILADRYAGVLDEKGLQYLGLVVAGGTKMAGLIDGLLALSRVASRGLKIETVDVGELAWTAFERLREVEPERSVELVVEPGLVARGDATLLGSVLDNLVGNAWKFTRDQASARIEVGRDGETFYVRDDGVGFDPKQAERIFEVFQRLHTDDQFPGSGVGLATVQRIISRHGGRIWAEGEPGVGATFRFTLPPNVS